MDETRYCEQKMLSGWSIRQIKTFGVSLVQLTPNCLVDLCTDIFTKKNPGDSPELFHETDFFIFTSTARSCFLVMFLGLSIFAVTPKVINIT